MASYDIVEGTTTDIEFQLLESGSAINLTTVTVTLLLADRTGAAVSSPGTVAVTNAAQGKVKLTPTDGTVFNPTKGPYYARWKLTNASGKVSYVPTSSIRDVWNIV